jgi:hypothetical protein
MGLVLHPWKGAHWRPGMLQFCNGPLQKQQELQHFPLAAMLPNPTGLLARPDNLWSKKPGAVIAGVQTASSHDKSKVNADCTVSEIGIII